jgi:hypothetical protein
VPCGDSYVVLSTRRDDQPTLSKKADTPITSFQRRFGTGMSTLPHNNIIIILSNHRNTGPKRGIEPHDEDTRLTHTDTTGLRPDPSPPLRHSATQRHASRTQRDTTRTRQTGVRKPTSLLLARDKGAQRQQGMHSHTQAKTIGAARAAHNHANSHGMRISHARRSRAALQFHNVPGTATPAWACNMQHGGRGVCMRQRKRIHANSRCRPPHTCRGAAPHHVPRPLGVSGSASISPSRLRSKL